MTHPERKAAMIARVRAAREAFELALAEVPADKLSHPIGDDGWTAKDVLAHVAWWEQHLVRRLKMGEDDDPRTTDEVNAAVYAENQARSMAEVRAMFDASGRALYEALAALPPELIEHDEFYQEIGYDTFTHYPDHAAALLRWSRTSGTPDA